MILRRPLLALSLAALAGFFAAGAVLGQDDHSGHQAGDMPAMDTPGKEAEAGYKRAMDVMHKAMSSLTYSGNADVDFVRGMIPHHQAAIDMAKVQIAHGKDMEIKKLAEDIVRAQENEIDQMEAWLKANAPK